MCASPSQKFISKSIRPRLSKKGNVVVVVIVVVVIVAILRYLGLCREAKVILAYSSNPYWLLKHAEIIQFHGSQPIK